MSSSRRRPSIVQAYYGTYDEVHDVECLKSGSGGSVVYARFLHHH